MEMRVGSLALLSGLEIWHYPELWSRSNTWLRSCIAVAVVQAGNCSSDLTPSLGTSTCFGYSPKQKQKQNKTKTRSHFPPQGESQGLK